MPIQPFDKVAPRQPLSAAELNRAFRLLEKLSCIKGVNGVVVREDGGGFTIDGGGKELFWLRINSAALGSSSPQYAWVEQIQSKRGTWEDYVNGRSGDATFTPAFPHDGNADVPIDTVALAVLSSDSVGSYAIFLDVEEGNNPHLPPEAVQVYSSDSTGFYGSGVFLAMLGNDTSPVGIEPRGVTIRCGATAYDKLGNPLTTLQTTDIADVLLALQAIVNSTSIGNPTSPLTPQKFAGSLQFDSVDDGLGNILPQVTLGVTDAGHLDVIGATSSFQMTGAGVADPVFGIQKALIDLGTVGGSLTISSDTVSGQVLTLAGGGDCFIEMRQVWSAGIPTVSGQIKIGCESLGFFGATPVLQQSSGGTAVGDDSVVINRIISGLQALGLFT